LKTVFKTSINRSDFKDKNDQYVGSKRGKLKKQQKKLYIINISKQKFLYLYELFLILCLHFM
jgi:hypothetical protein